MRILWISPFLLHPTNSGGQIRSLGTLKQLHQRHEVHFATMQLDGQQEGVSRVSEYSSKAYFVAHRLPPRGSIAFVPQFLGNFLSDLPLTIERDVLPPMRARLEDLRGGEKFDAIICDFLSTAVNLRDFSDVVLFQHNVETVIWERMSRHGSTVLHGRYFARQAAKMRAFEERVCRACRHVIAVSEADAQRMRAMFGIEHVTAIPTGVDVDYFAKPEKVEPVADLVFTGSMDWLPNVDGVKWFVNEILPLVRARLPECTLAVMGRNAGREIVELAERDRRIQVTGTVPDIRPYLWGAKAAIVPLRIGGGTRLKIYEAMAASTPQISTTIGAEGLDYRAGRDIHIADQPEQFAEHCVALIESEGLRREMADVACKWVNERFGWPRVSLHFERVLEQVRR